VINVAVENVVALSELPDRIPPRAGRRLSIPSVYRWSTRGIRGVVLETVQIGGTRYTSMEAFQRFTNALTALRDGRPPAERAPVSVRKKSAEAKTTAALDAIGI
jgi:hypothetical protein